MKQVGAHGRRLLLLAGCWNVLDLGPRWLLEQRDKAATYCLMQEACEPRAVRREVTAALTRDRRSSTVNRRPACICPCSCSPTVSRWPSSSLKRTKPGTSVGTSALRPTHHGTAGLGCARRACRQGKRATRRELFLASCWADQMELGVAARVAGPMALKSREPCGETKTAVKSFPHQLPGAVLPRGTTVATRSICARRVLSSHHLRLMALPSAPRATCEIVLLVPS